jgi:hypothetical protein
MSGQAEQAEQADQEILKQRRERVKIFFKTYWWAVLAIVLIVLSYIGYVIYEFYYPETPRNPSGIVAAPTPIFMAPALEDVAEAPEVSEVTEVSEVALPETTSEPSPVVTRVFEANFLPEFPVQKPPAYMLSPAMTDL